MKKTYILIVLLIAQVSIYSQNHRFYTSFKLQNYNPIWQKAMIDSSIIGLINPFQQYYEPVYFDGFSHFYSYDIFKLDPVFYEGNIYLAELGQTIGDGAYIECIDELTSESKWKTVYDHRLDKRREYPVRTYINNNGQFQILGHRENLSMPFSSLPWPMWFNSVFTMRKYDSSTGDLIERDTSDETSPNTCKMTIPFFIYMNKLYSTHIINNSEKFRFILTIDSIFKIFDVDSKGLVLDSVIVNRSSDETTYRDRTYFINDDRILHFRFTGGIRSTHEDSFHVYYTVYDKYFNIIKTKDLKDDLIPAYEYKCDYAGDHGFIITGQNSEKIGDTNYFVMTANSFDINGELKESVRLENEDGSPINLIPYITAISIGDGTMLISSNEKDEEGYSYLVFFKTNGSGNFDKITKWKITDKKHEVAPLYFWKTPSGKILVKWVHANTDLVQLGYGATAMVYMLIEPEDLGIKTSLNEIAESKPLHFYPNPASSSISINCEDNDASMIEVIDRLGRVVYRDKSQGCEELSVDITGYASGLYFVRLMDDEGRIVGTGKVVKE